MTELALTVGQSVHAAFRVHRPQPKMAQNGKKYWSLALENSSGAIRAHIWEDRYRGREFSLDENKKIEVQGRVREFDRKLIVDIHDCREITRPEKDSWSLIPSRWFSQPGDAERLRFLTDQIQTVALRDFLGGIFADDGLAWSFLTLPASHRHHHSWRGGLFCHSLECAEMVAAMPGFRHVETELGMVAALLHDIGKIRTQGSGALRFQQRVLLPHDIFTLEILSRHLERLDQQWPEGGISLRYLLTWKPGRTVPAMTMAEIIACADRVSTGQDRERQAFSALPKGSHLVIENRVNRWRTPAPPEVRIGA